MIVLDNSPKKYDTISEKGILNYLSDIVKGIEITVLPTASSTNTFVRERAVWGAVEGYTVIANSQSGGRGRLGRSFFSPLDTGIYMSILLRPKALSGDMAVNITTMAAVSMCEAISEISGEKVGIKWVNDIYIGNKKVCGILTEGSFGVESGSLDFAILGLGINLYPPKEDIPTELKEIFGTIFQSPRENTKNLLIATFLNRFFFYYTSESSENYVDYYRKYSLCIGRQVTLISASGTRTAFVLDVDKRCRLKVRYTDGSIGIYSSGEISIRL